jgi:intraflagellar transport protein 81
MALEKIMRDKEENYAKQKGGKYMKRDDFRQYAANLRVKNANFKVMKKVLDEIKAEVVVLKRTEQILKSRTANVESVMKELEAKQGISGYSNVEDQI